MRRVRLACASFPPSARRLTLASLFALVALTTTACGFQLRGQAQLPFKTINVPNLSQLGADLARNIEAASNAKIVDSPAEAEAILSILGEAREKVILSLNTQGQVQEYTLRYRVRFQVADGRGGDFIAPSDIVLRRDITFNNQVLGKENEEELLYRDMRVDAVQQILRRLRLAKLRPADESFAPPEPSLFE